MVRFRVVPFVLVVAGIELLFGLGFYLIPAGLRAEAYRSLSPQLPSLSTAFMAGGVLLLVTVRYRLAAWLRGLLSWLAAVPLFLLALHLGGQAIWSGAGIYGLLGLGLLTAPFLAADLVPPPAPGTATGPQTREPRTGEGLDRPDLLAVVGGVLQTVVGAWMLLTPGFFATPSYAPVAPALPWLGGLGLVGGIVLLIPGRQGTWAGPGSLGRRLVGAAFPLLLAFNWAAIGLWTGIISWGGLGLVILTQVPDWIGPRQPRRRGRDVEAQVVELVERVAESWTWAQALVMVALRTLVGPETLVVPTVVDLFVLAALLYNTAAHWIVPQWGSRYKRVLTHLTFLAVGTGMVMMGAGPAGFLLLALLATIPPTTARILGAVVGRRMLALVVAVAVLSTLAGTLAAGRPLPPAVGYALAAGLVLLAAGAAGVRTAAESHRLVRELAQTQANLEERLAQLERLDRIGRAIRRSLDLDEVLRTTVAEVGRSLAASRCFLWLEGEDGMPLYQYTAPGIVPVSREYLESMQQGSLARESEEVVTVADVAVDARVKPERRRAMLGQGIRAVMAAPIRVEGRLLGVLRLHQDAPRQWRAAEVTFLSAVAGQVGLALVQAQAHQTLARRHEELQRAYSDLQAAHEELQAQSEELTAQQEELRTLNEQLQEQSEALLEQRDQLQRALHAQQRAEEAQRRLVAILEETPDYVMTADENGTVHYFNRAARRLLGLAGANGGGRVAGGVTRHIREVHPPEEWTHIRSVGIPTALREGVWAGESCFLDRTGRKVPVSQVIIAHRTATGTVSHLSTVARDISQQKQFEQQLLYLANHDPLTQLPNRRRFREELETHLAEAQREGRAGAIFFMDLNDFKYVNDTLGHGAGDDLLVQMAEWLRRSLRPGDLLARLGGDEFAVLLPGTTAREAEAIAAGILDDLRRRTVMVRSRPINITASIGIALFPQHGTTAEQLLTHADLAMYEAKSNRHMGYCVYTPNWTWESRVASLSWEQRIRRALEEERFVLHGQPILDLVEGRVAQYELLLRMVGEDGSIIPPDSFLGVAERAGLVHLLDRWVITQAVRLIAESSRTGRNWVLAVNVSGRSLVDPELLPTLAEAIRTQGIDPAALTLEVTESAAVSEAAAQKFIQSVKELGCRLALDDFGQGFSSFSQLKQLPVDYLKIDGSFIRSLPRSPVDQHLVRAMAEMARGLNKEATAEFVGDAETVRLLRSYGVRYAQGYFVGVPAPLPRE